MARWQTQAEQNDNQLFYNLHSLNDESNSNERANNRETMQHTKENNVSWQNANTSDYFAFENRGFDHPGPSQRHSGNRPRLDSQSSIVDGLLSEIYDHWHDHKHDSFDSDTFTECSSTAEFAHWRRSSFLQEMEVGGRHIGYLHRGNLQDYSKKELKNVISEISRLANHMSARLVRQLKRRERRMSKLQNNCDIVTAVLQASSAKRRIDTRMRFTVEPALGDNAFEQWKDAMKAVARLPQGIPDEFRKKVWLSLADHHIKDMQIDWEKTVRFAFNEKSNPDDNKLGIQIVKDLHRTGCSGFSGEDNEEERALLKRILLAYARWNKAVGYCQGFNVIAALLLEVMDRKEADALKVMIYMIDYVLPQSYFANNLRALSVDMAVFRDLLKIFPKLSKHLDYLQHAQDQASGGCYEPPLTNVFTMQWFLTLFATCLPKSTVLRVWDSILLDGSEILLRTALVIWGKLSSRILSVSTADEFYTLMGDITQEMLEGNILDADSMIKSIYSIAPFPFPKLSELREKYTYNIRPFTPASKRNWTEGGVLPSDEDDIEDEDIEAITCFTGIIPTGGVTQTKTRGLENDEHSGSIADISSLGPGAYGQAPTDTAGVSNVPAYMERMTTDIPALKKQYAKLRQRQTQAHIILTTASAKQQALKPTRPMVPKIESPGAVNHLFLNKGLKGGRNRYVAAGPRIANMYPIMSPAATGNTKSVQPITPQAVGDTKCKWVQKKQQSFDHVAPSDVKDMTVQTRSMYLTQTPGSCTSPTKKQPTSPTKTQATSPRKYQEISQNDHVMENKIFPSVGQSTVTKELLVTAEVSIIESNKLSVNQGAEQFDVDSKDKSIERDMEDSGLGLSLGSPVVSSSSTESSPYHHIGRSSGNQSALSTDDSMDCFPVSVEETGSRTQSECVTDSSSIPDQSIVNESAIKLDEFYAGTKDIWESNTEYNFSNHDVLALRNKKEGANYNEAKNEFKDTINESGAKTHQQGNVNNNAQDMEDLHLEKKNNLDRTLSGVTETKSYSQSGNDSVVNVDDGKVDIHLHNIGATSMERHTKTENNSKMIDESQKQNKGDINNGLVQGADNNTGDSVQADNVQSTVTSSGNPSVGGTRRSESLPEVHSRHGFQSKSFQQYYNNKQNLREDASSSLENQLKKNSLPKKTFNPFPVKHVNQNRARAGIKLGLYKQSTLEEFERNLKSQALWGK